MASGSGLLRDTVFLTTKAIETLRPSDCPYRVSDKGCVGLAVRVAPDGGMTWDLAFRIKGTAKVRRTSLGRVADVPLKAARDRANELTKAARAGVDMLAQEFSAQEAAEARITVAKLIEMYVRRRVMGRLRTATDIERRLNRALSSILHRHAADIRRRDVREIFDACADAGFQREAEKRRQTAGAMFRWALAQDLIEVNPTAGLAGYDPGTPRDRVLSADEIVALWNFLDQGGFPPNTTAILKLQLAIGARVGEISGLRVEEIDQSTWVWRLPAARSKNARGRATPIVGIAKGILRACLSLVPSGPLFVTESGKPMTSSDIGSSLIARRRRLQMAHFTTHDLRRTVSASMVEMGLPMDTVAAVIGHELNEKATRTLARHYSPGERLKAKTDALTVWDARLRELIGAVEPTDNVLHLRPTG